MFPFNKENTIEQKVAYVLAHKRTSGKIKRNRPSSQIDKNVFQDIINQVQQDHHHPCKSKICSPVITKDSEIIQSSPLKLKPQGKICKNQQKQRQAFLTSKTQKESNKTIQIQQNNELYSKTAEQIIEEYKSLKKNIEKKESVVGILLKRGKGRQQFIKRFIKQIQLEKQLRNFKHQITDKNKQSLISILSQQYLIGEQALVLHAEEFDPFFVGKKIDNLDVFACQFYIAFSRVKSHWNEQIVNKFQEECLLQIFEQLNQTSNEEVLSLKTFAKQLGIIFGSYSCAKIRDVYGIYSKLRPFYKDNFLSLLKCNRTQNIKKNDL